MNHQTWQIPAERRRPGAVQALVDLWFTLVLFWHFLTGPFVKAPPPLTEGTKASTPPVIIVPGFICRPAIYRRLQAAIHQAGFPCHILDLSFQVGSIYNKALHLSRYLTELGAPEVYVIGHSMGGLIVTTCVHQGEMRIRHGWTLAAPLWGTNIIYGLYGVGAFALAVNLSTRVGWDLLLAAVFLVPALHQMLPGSDLLKFVSGRYLEMTRLTSVFCAFDLIAFRNPLDEPGSATRFGRESDVLFPEAGHNNIAMGANAIGAMVAALEAQHRGE